MAKGKRRIARKVKKWVNIVLGVGAAALFGNGLMQYLQEAQFSSGMLIVMGLGLLLVIVLFNAKFVGG